MTQDIISSAGIRKHLADEIKNKIKIDVKDSVGSTNDEVKALAKKGEQEGYLLVSRSQTKGKGRLGRSFFSPDGTGVYMSLLLKPECKPEQATLITTAAAVAVCRALESVGAHNVQIKWVNDIFVNGKKVCGILTEAGFGAGGDTLDFAVLGVGVNVYAPDGDFPEELKEIAGGIFDAELPERRNIFIARFLEEFFVLYKALTEHPHIEEYRKRCFVLGKAVNVISQGKSTPARAVDIDDDCNLLIEYSDGERAVLGTGEISVRSAE